MTDRFHRYTCGWVLAACLGPALWAQYLPAPTEYSVTQVNSMFGQPVTMQIYRDGDLVVMDHPDHHVRSLYNLKTHADLGWDTQDPANGCSNGTLNGDWGDPFTVSDIEELLKNSRIPPKDDTVNGIATKVFEASDPQSKATIKVWREPKYGMVIKAEMAMPSGAPTTILETRQFSLGKPPAAMFVLPPACANAAPPPPPAPTPAQRFATETGDNGANFVDGTLGPGSSNSCSMLMRFVKAGSMQPLSDVQVALDLSYDIQHPPHYVMGGSANGRATFSGGGLREYTAEVLNGVLRINNVPAVFDAELAFAGGNKGAASALVYRKCSGPQTVLLYVMKNPDDVSAGGDWLWVQSGKFAAGAAH